MSLFTKKRIALGLTMAAVLALAQCDLVRVSASQLIHTPPLEVNLPMGEGKQVSYPVRSWIDKPYRMALIAEYINWDKYISEAGIKDLPYSISIACYRLEKGKEILFYQKEITEKEQLYLGRGWTPNKSYSSESEAGIIGLGGFRLPYGTYRCDFKDTSTPEIKNYLKEAGVIRTFINIMPYEPFIY